jgi:hypothetical protein
VVATTRHYQQRLFANVTLASTWTDTSMLSGARGQKERGRKLMGSMTWNICLPGPTAEDAENPQDEDDQKNRSDTDTWCSISGPGEAPAECAEDDEDEDDEQQG